MNPATDTRLPTGTVTFLFSDIEGSTRLLAALGDRYPPLLEGHAAIMRDAISAHDGTVVSTEGDSFFAVFPSALDAIGTAADAQRALADHEWPAGSDLSVRMGIHTGEGRLGGDNYVGMDVHRAARIAAAGHGGQVILSGTTQTLVDAGLVEGLSLADLGSHRLKDLPSVERLWQLDIPGLPNAFPTLRTQDARPNNLSTLATPLIGRDEEVRTVADLLRGRRLLTITGPGGAGKTRLALAVGSQLLDEFSDGVFFVALEDARDRSTVVSAIAQALGVREKPDRDLEDGVMQFLRERKLLLILDNFEQVVSAAPLVSDLLTGSSALRVVVTSREVLRLSMEQAYDVPPLELPDPSQKPSLAALAQVEAVALFVERAKAVKPDFELTADNATAVSEICARLDGLPLAIELAAARLRLLAPQQILERLDRRLALLAGGAADVPERQRTLRGAVEWSYELLGEPERRLFERLSVFAGGWTLEAAEDVCRPSTELDVDLLDGLSSLANKSLVKAQEDDAEPRFGMLQTIREFALERLEERTEAEAIRRRHAEFMMELAQRAGPELVGFEMRHWYGRLRREEENLRSALRWALEVGEPDLGLRTAAPIWRYWHYWGVLREGRDWLTALLKPGNSALPAATEAYGRNALASLLYWLGDMPGADALYLLALNTYRELGDEAQVTETVEGLAWTALGQGDHDAASARSREAMERYRTAGDRLGVARMDAWMRSGSFLMGLGASSDDALSASMEAIEAARENGNALDALNWQGELAEIYRRIGDIPRAIREFHTTTELYYEMGYVGMLPWLKLLARLELDRDNAERAATLAAIAGRAVEDLGGELPEAITQVGTPLEDARKLLAEEAYASAVAKGRAMTFDEAVAYALEA